MDNAGVSDPINERKKVCLEVYKHTSIITA